MKKLKSVKVSEVFKKENLDLVSRTYAKAQAMRHLKKAIDNIGLILEIAWTTEQAEMCLAIANKMVELAKAFQG